MKTNKEIRNIWEYKVNKDFLSEFLIKYSPNGDWAKLFKKYLGYIKTDLIQNVNHPDRFITIDYWESYQSFLYMKNNIGYEYEKLDKLCENFTTSENHIGIYNI